MSSIQSHSYDTIIIGAGMSGLAAGIRLSMFDKKVCILEKHRIPGGLNSYYKRGHREFDVGLHALTNYVPKGSKGTPLSKLLRQLRIPYDALELIPQNYSKVMFESNELKFNNNINLLNQEVHEKFPQEIDGYLKLLEYIKQYNEVDLANKYLPAKSVVKKYIKSDQLCSMLFCPLMVYGSAWENDMDFSQFVIMFKSIFLEGFSRPRNGVRTIIKLLIDKFEALGGEIHYNTEVTSINTKNLKTKGLQTKKGQEYYTENILSSMGLPETSSIINNENENTNDAINFDQNSIGKMSFTETILMTKEYPKELNQDATIIFYNQSDEYHYRCPSDFFDAKSSVICFPNNFLENDSKEGIMRLTFMANYNKWKELDKPIYREKKNEVLEASLLTLEKVLSKRPEINFSDVFTPTTIEKYTGHFNGTVYGATKKARDGKTKIEGLNIIGTDQGFLGIVGSMLSGISMANLHSLQGSR